jgi:tetratricopeptide (TPR) repeat protein
MGASAAWEACIAQVEILQRAARQRKIQACTEVLAQSPAESESRRKEALKQRALAYAVAQRNLAIADYSAALEIDSTDVESLLARGVLYLKGGGWGNERGQYDLAIADFNQAIVLNPRNSQAFIYRGDAHRATFGSSQAAQDYRQALEIDPASAAARIRLDSSQQDLQPQKEKNEDYETCRNRTLNADKRIEACSTFISTIPEFYNKSHRILIASKDSKSVDSLKSLKKSVNSLSVASDIDMGMTERGYAFAFRALGYLEKGDLESALVDLNHAIDRAPIMIYGNGEASTRDRLLLRRGEIYLETKEYDRAEADFRAVLKVNFVPDGHSNLALLHFTREHYDLALSEVALALKRDPKNALAFSLRGRIELKRQQYQRALKDCQQAVELSKPDRASNAERCIEAARQALAQTSSNSQSASGKSE